MSRLFIGNLDGVGPAVKIMANDTDDPRTTPNTDWWKFRFNSETAEIGYISTSAAVDLPLPAQSEYTGAYQTSYWPPGSGGTNFSFQTTYRNSGGYSLSVQVDLANLLGRGDRIWYLTYDASEWRYPFISIRHDYPNEVYLEYFINTRETAHIDSIRAGERREAIGSYKLNGVWKIGAFGGIPPNYQDGYSGLECLARSGSYYPGPFTVAGFLTDMPVDDEPYPAVSGSPVTGKKIVRIDPTMAKVAKPGFDVESATDDQLIIGDDKPPLLVAKTGFFTLAPAAQQNIDVDLPITPTTLVDYQLSTAGKTLSLPPWASRNTKVLDVAYRIVGQQVQFRNDSNITFDVRYFIMADDGAGNSSGSAKVLETENGVITIRKPNTAGTKARDILADSRATYMPIVSQAYVPIASFSNTGADVGNKMFEVTFSNDGSWKPYVIARAKYHAVKGADEVYYYLDFYAKYVDFYNRYSRDSFVARVEDTKVTFYVSDNTVPIDTGLQDGGTNTLWFKKTIVGVRYFIFAVPNSL